MKNNKGQSLVEFVIILPVIILLILAILDFAKITYHKTTMESLIDTVVNDLRRGKSSQDIDKNLTSKDVAVKSQITVEEEDTKVKLTKSINIMTPGLNLVLGKSYQVTVDRVIVNE